MKNKKAFILLSFTCCVVAFFIKCSNEPNVGNDPRGNVYAGAASCRSCHPAIYDSYIETAHYNATRPTTKDNVYGSFSPGKNIFSYDFSTKIVMEDRDSGLYQVAYVNGKQTEAHRFDITFGKKHAQTFLYWNNNKTFELPVSFYTSVKSWATSPGFSKTEANFKRPIGINCYQCHSSFVDNKLSMTSEGVEETLDKNSIIYGIDCERCHGPAINHVNYHTAYPDIKEAKYIVTSRSLNRQQKLDECAVCHSGNEKQKEISAFKFKRGDTLGNFFSPWAKRRNNIEFDVHGNQYQLLSQSKCFLGSKTLTCTTCHNPHSDASNNLVEYSKKCLTCHPDTKHSSTVMSGTSINIINENCIDCHMPKQASEAITFYLQGSPQKNAYLLRTHKIAIYLKNTGIVQTFVKFYSKNKS
ncbi:MAG TPA: cytochrome c3 family protein [Segetibacter sp.]